MHGSPGKIAGHPWDQQNSRRVVGGMKCIVFVWVGMLVLTILCNTEIGQKGLGLIRGDTVLDFLYDKNIFIRIFTGIFYGG